MFNRGLNYHRSVYVCVSVCLLVCVDEFEGKSGVVDGAEVYMFLFVFDRVTACSFLRWNTQKHNEIINTSGGTTNEPALQVLIIPRKPAVNSGILNTRRGRHRGVFEVQARLKLPTGPIHIRSLISTMIYSSCPSETFVLFISAGYLPQKPGCL